LFCLQVANKTFRVSSETFAVSWDLPTASTQLIEDCLEGATVLPSSEVENTSEIVVEDQHTVAVAMGTKAELAIPVLLELIDPLSGTSPAVHNDLSGQMGERRTPELRSNSRKMHPCKLPLDLVSNWQIWAVGVLAWMQKDLPRKVPIC
jgi:hypothetical protein